MCNDRAFFESYTLVSRPTTIQGAGGTLSAVGIGNVPLTVETKNGTRNKIVLLGVLHVPGLFTNLVSGSQLFQKGFYLHGGDQTVNSLFDNTEIASAPIQDGLFVLKTHKGTEKSLNTSFAQAATTTTDHAAASLRTWYRRLGHPSYANLFGNSRGIDMSKLKLEKDLLLCRICIRAKQRRNPSYKPQVQAEDICEELHWDLMAPITPAGWNGCRYALTTTDSRLRCRWVENLHEKREAGPTLRKFITFVETQTGRKVKRIRMDQGREYGVHELEAWRAKKGIKIEFSVAYSPEMNGIAERTNGACY